MTNIQLTMFSKGHTAVIHLCEAVSNLRMKEEVRGKAEGARVSNYVYFNTALGALKCIQLKISYNQMCVPMILDVM